jgi:hypothetical protein
MLGGVLGEDPVSAPRAGFGSDESFITDPGHLEQVPCADMTEALEPTPSPAARGA